MLPAVGLLVCNERPADVNVPRAVRPEGNDVMITLLILLRSDILVEHLGLLPRMSMVHFSFVW